MSRLALDSPLGSIHILIADPDQRMAQLTRSVLSQMGFRRIMITKSGADGISLLRNETIDLIISDWNMSPLDGISLVHHLRQDPASPNRMLPVIMLTARSERQDVEKARDAGINEYVLKPFTSRSIFRRIAQIIENPRKFVLTQAYVGPDRRHGAKPPAGVAERRGERAALITRDAVKPGAPADTKLVLPDFSLKEKIGVKESVEKLVTAEMLDASQQEIITAQADGLQWLREDTRALKALYAQLLTPAASHETLEQLGIAALSVKSRAGLFGYNRAADLAGLLYRFAQDAYNHANPNHRLVVEKYIHAIAVLLDGNIRGDGGQAGAELMADLQALVAKYR